jgi:PAS domain S-box-containing protein
MTTACRAAELSEARWRDLLDLAPDAFFLANLDGRLTDVNQAACRMLGYSREELVGKTILDIIPPEDAPRLAAVKMALLVPGHVHTAEWTQKRKDGSSVPVEVSSNILPDGRWQAFVRDITERRRTEDERQVFVSLLENSFDFIGIADATGKPVYLNPAGRRMVGLPADYPVEETRIPDYYLPEERAFVEDVIVKSMVERGRWSGETHFRNWQTGEAIPVSDEHFTIRDPSGERVLGMGTVTRDITERKRAEEERQRIDTEQRFLAKAGALMASSLDYELTLSAVGELVVRDFADWCIVDIIDHDERPVRLKVVSAEPRLAPLAARLEQISLDRRRPHLGLTALETRRPFLIEQMTAEKLESLAQSADHLQLLRAIGPRSVMAVPLLIRGQLLGALVFIASTPSRVYGPGDLRLAEALAERAALAIENGHLYHEALRATRLRDEMLGVVAHDLRNPLAAIQMQATALKRKGSEPERRNPKPRETFLRAANRMNRLIEDLLDVSLSEAGQLGIERSRISARQLVADAVEAQRPLASPASLEVRLEPAGDLPDVLGDHSRLLQVLENLIGNAIKFTPGGGRITVGAAPRENEVLFWVADTGSGLSPDELPHVFDRFWQARKGARKGAGLGLPIARGIVETHGGRIWVESTPGRGSIFFFTIPQATAVEEPRPESTQSPHG